jgi:hypothetical protein
LIFSSFDLILSKVCYYSRYSHRYPFYVAQRILLAGFLLAIHPRKGDSLLHFLSSSHVGPWFRWLMEKGISKEIELALLIADLSGYTALTEAHGNMSAAEAVTRYVEIVHEVLHPSARLVERVGDEVLIAADEAASLVQTAINLRMRAVYWRWMVATLEKHST